MYKIIGLRVEKYVGTASTGHNCDFLYAEEVRDRHVLLVTDCYGRDKKEITLSYEEGECGSGWCTASWGQLESKDVGSFACKTHKPIKDLFFDLDKLVNTDSEDTFACDTFNFSENGGCDYYPSGTYDVDMSLFTPLRVRDKRPVYVFKGDSNLGKSHIAALTGKDVFETDANGVLPDTISSEIIVIGGKYPHKLEDITSRIFDLESSELVFVDFSK